MGEAPSRTRWTLFTSNSGTSLTMKWTPPILLVLSGTRKSAGHVWWFTRSVRAQYNSHARRAKRQRKRHRCDTIVPFHGGAFIVMFKERSVPFFLCLSYSFALDP